MSLSQFSRGGGGVGWGGRVAEGVSDTKLGSSCLYLLLLLVLLPLPVMPAVAGLLLLFELLQVFGLEGAHQRVSELPVVLAVLIDQGHLRLAQDGQQVLVLACARGPLGAGVEGRRHQPSRALHQHVVDSPAGQNHQLQLDQRVLEVLLRGCTLVHARVRWLQRPQEEALFCLQNPTIGTHLQRQKKKQQLIKHL